MARTHTDYRVTFAVLATAALAFSLLQSLIIPAIPQLEHTLHTSESGASWLLTAYLLSAAIATPILGRVGDMIGKERVIVAVLVALSVGSLISALATTLPVMLVGRVIQGAAGAVFPLAFGIIRDEFPAVRVASAIGVMSAILGAGAGAGIVLAGPILVHLNYHWLFWIPMMIAVIATLCAWLFVPESPVRTPGRVSWLAAVLLSAWLVALLLGVSEAPSWGWGSPRVIGLVALAVVLAVAWVWVELRATEPLVDMHMMQRRAVWTNNLVAFMFGIGMYAVIGFLPEFVQTPTSTGYGFGASIIQSGLFLLPLTVTMFIGGLLSGRIAATIGSKSAVIIGSTASTGAYLLLAFAHSEKWEIYLASTLLGIGLGLAFSAMANLIVQAVPPAQTGVASGMNANIRTIGGAIGAAVMSSIVASQILADGYPAESDYTKGFLFLAVMTVVAVAAALLIPRSPGAGAAPDLAHHLEHAELAVVPGGSIAEY